MGKLDVNFQICERNCLWNSYSLTLVIFLIFFCHIPEAAHPKPFNTFLRLSHCSLLLQRKLYIHQLSALKRNECKNKYYNENETLFNLH